MKQFYFLFIALFLSILSFGQVDRASKIYAYKQKVNPGMIRADRDGNQVRRQPQYNYFIYVASTSKIIPVEIWINGEVYSVAIRTISNTPVEHIGSASEGKPEVLVPKTSKTVLQIIPSMNKPAKPSQKGKTLAAKNEMVIFYKGGKQFYYKTVSKLKELDPVNMQ